MICVEPISKLHGDFNGQGQSKEYVKRFFNKFLSEPDKEKLKESFIDHTTMTMAAFNFERVIDLLYDLRCDVVHEGKFWAFKFSDGEYPILHVDPKVTVHLTFIELRDIVVRGCINVIKDKLKP